MHNNNPTHIVGASILASGNELRPGDNLWSPNEHFQLSFDIAGLVLHHKKTGTSKVIVPSGVTVLKMQTDGYLVATPIKGGWIKGTGKPGSVMALQDDGNIVIYHPEWAQGI